MTKSKPSAPSKQVICNVCQDATAGTPVFSIAGFTLVHCPVCGVLRVNPRLEDAALKEYYDETYWASRDSVVRGYSDYTSDAANIRRTFRRRMQGLLREKADANRWLDVGCAAGFLVQEAGEAGWDAFGVEWSGYIIRQAGDEVKTRITAGSLLEAAWPQGFDVITLWDYLEHSPHPREDLEKAVSLLNPEGRISIIIPDAGSCLAKMMGVRWEEFKKPQEHLYFFTRSQLVRLCQSLGLQIESASRAGKYASLGFAFSRFQSGDGILYWGARFAIWLFGVIGLLKLVVYINPQDKLHLICRKKF
ncbi:class I SAM-dependent methyltransferase [bacterium]|nr:class I SAM-dependent methyltransferase [bacterium]